MLLLLLSANDDANWLRS